MKKKPKVTNPSREASKEEIDRLCDQFEDAWRSGQQPDLASFLEQCSSANPRKLFADLMQIECEWRQKRGENPTVVDFLDRFDQFTDEIETVAFTVGMVQEETISPDGANLPNSRLEQYRLVKKLGGGACGVVWKAWDTWLKRHVAVKIPRNHELHTDELKRFLREGKLTAQMNHTGIVPVLNCGRSGNLAFIVSEFISGENLKERIKSQKFSQHDAARICADIADAVHHAHEKKVIHRDIKPANIILDDEDRVHVTDFGIAKLINDTDDLTRTGEGVGTPAYMSPEQLWGTEVDARTDVYGIGGILYNMLTGHTPRSGREGKESSGEENGEPREPREPRTINPKVDPALETICMKCLAQTPEQRYATAADLAGDLRRFLADQPILGRRKRESLFWQHRRKLLISGGLLALGAVGAPTLYLLNRGPTVPQQEVLLETHPSGAKVAFVPLDPLTGDPTSEIIEAPGKSPVKLLVPPGDYLVVATLGDQFHEVMRTVPAEMSARPGGFPHQFWKVTPENVVELAAVTIPSGVVTRKMEIVSASADEDSLFIDRHPVTKQEIEDIIGPVAGQAGQEYFALEYDRAVSAAEQMGKRLPRMEELHDRQIANDLDVWTSTKPLKLQQNSNQLANDFFTPDHFRIVHGRRQRAVHRATKYPFRCVRSKQPPLTV